MSDGLIMSQVFEEAIRNGLTTPEEYTDTAYPFRPVKCTEAALANLTAVQGYVYFATDTKKIFFGNNGEFVPMGGNSGFYYGHKAFSDPADLSFTIDDIDGNNLPNVGDLIINVSTNIERDGFYRVLEIVSSTEVNTAYLPIGGGGGGGASSGGGEILITPLTPQSGTTVVGRDYFLEYSLEVYDNNENPVLTTGQAVWNINGVRIDGGSIQHGGKYRFNVANYLDSKRDTNTVILTISVNTGGAANKTQTYTWTVKSVNLYLTWEWDQTNLISDSSFTLRWTPHGNVDCRTWISIDDGATLDVDLFYKDIKASATGNLTPLTLPAQSYGAHKITMWLSADINDTTETSVEVSNMVVFISGGTEPILAVAYYDKIATQYDTISIPFTVYDPNDIDPEVEFLVDGNSVSKLPYGRDKVHRWNYLIGVSGDLRLTLKCGDKEEHIDLEVAPLNLGIDEPSESLQFNLKANSFSGNDELKTWNQNGVSLKFSDNFDWVNGGLQYEIDSKGNIRKYICVRQGTQMQVKYPLFGSANTNINGKNFKFCFKAMNCYEYDAPVLECYEDQTKIGLKLDAQKAIFSTSANTNFNTQYCENSYIEFEAEIWPDVKDKTEKILGDRFLMLWVDGVPAAVQPFSVNTPFQHRSTENYITIGSDKCDVYVYLMKVYERQLNEIEHLYNFILDAPTTQEMLDRFERNDILENGEISYSKLVAKNPGCRAYLYDIPHMTTSKDNKVEGCTYYELINEYNDLNKPYYRGEGAITYVQGTSSAAYGTAAFNLRTDFLKKGVLYNKDGNEVAGWQVSDNAIPINIACTKVNVASCENANNALNQEWYNKYQPYWDGHRRKSSLDGKSYRDCMEFNFGVIFVKDNNKTINYYDSSGNPSEPAYLKANVFLDTDGYTQAPYYKQYAVCNMGNDKKNVEVFHDIDNPKACCVEVTNNQTFTQAMNTTITVDEFNSTENFEFRYPDGNEKATAEMKQGFVRFVNWMANSNPGAATGEELSSSETFGPYTFKGFKPPKYVNGAHKEDWDDGTGSDMGVSLKGNTVYEYAGTYTHDTYEYRMAKMLSECEDYLVMDSVMFHYLFIQRHTMVDNVAKNTFWSSEDCLHWDLTKNYDNDTSDGNNNSGYLTYGYGVEVLDENNAFNAPTATWLVFMNGLNEAQENLYQQLSEKGAWDPEAYLKLFEQKQSLIPEICWIFDYIRKYIRPRRLGLDINTFLERLEGGKKTHQRRQYETYQDYYINSKYLAGGNFKESGAIDMRLNSDPAGIVAWSKDLTIPIKTYIDMYPSGLIGTADNVNTWRGEKIKRTDIGYIPIGELLDSPKDGTCYLYGASMIQSLDGLSSVYPTYAKLTAASKLRNLNLGSEEEDYYNAALKSATIDTNTMLESVYIQNAGLPTGIGDLSLSNLKLLKKLKIDGSTYKNLTLADGGIIDTLYVNALTSLKMYNLANLVDFKMDDGIYDTLQTLEIVNCPLMNQYSYRLVYDSPLLNYYYLTEVDWEITDDSQVSIEGNKIVGIKILDKLKELTPQTKDSRTSLTGKLKINLNTAYNVNEYDLYSLYNKDYPNLAIEYAGSLTVEKAYRIIFYKNDLDNSDVLYTVLADGSETLGVLTSKNGPVGTAITQPIKDPDNYYTYHWNLASAPETFEDDIWYPYDWTIDNIHKTDEELMNIYPSSDMEIYPYFTRIPRLYNITLKDWDGTEIPYSTEEGFVGVKYGTIITLPNYLYRENTKEHMRYAFKGWISSADRLTGNSDPTFYPIKYTITSNFTAYAFYREEDCRTTPTNIAYFDIINMSSGHNACGISMYGNLGISVKDEYRNVLQGKITLPSVNANGTKIKCIFDFRGTEKITDVYFLEDAEYISIIDSYGFNRSPNDPYSNLQHIYLPNTIKYIGHNTFQSNLELLTVGPLENPTQLPSSLLIIGSNSLGGSFGEATRLMKISINELPDSIEKICSNAFYWGVPNVIITKIPPNLTTIEQWAFYMCDSVGFDDIGYSNKLESIGSSFLYESGLGFWEAKKDTIDINKIIIGKSVKLSKDTFNSYKGIEYATFCFLGSPMDYGYNTSEEAATALGLGAGRYVFSYDPSVT